VTAVQEFTEVFRTGHRQGRDLLLELVGAFGDRDAGRAPGADRRGRRGDGSTAEIHDLFRGVPGVFGWTLDAWRAAIELGLKVQINTTVTGHNVLQP
jgi:hypothetical protein